ncbi:MAG: 4Fe-4S dicluster domain-containing protein, partial [Clostridia bacterium]|nr:4Fe-4S dicluster domain-containing protein [Clostridia bacterium]
YIAHIEQKACPAKVCKKLINYTIDVNRCVSCARCVAACPTGSIYKTDYIAPGNRFASYQIEDEKCLRCGACIATCKLHAIIVEAGRK